MVAPAWLPPELSLLDERCPLPLDRPFTRAQTAVWGISRHYFRILLARRLVRPMVRGTYAVAQLPDTIDNRAAALRLVLPPGAVVTDRTAAWLHGIDVLPRSAVHEPVPLDVFSAEESRLRRPGVSSGVRGFLPHDLTTVRGVVVTTPVRTALDLGRLLKRYDAIGALDALLRRGVERAALEAELCRFKGYRGVVQLRALVPHADPRAESMPESALRLHGIDAGVPELTPQLWVCDEWGREIYRLDLGHPGLRYGAEYHGERFHVGDEHEAHDRERGQWLDDRGWEIDTFWKADLYGPRADPGRRLWDGVMRARARLGSWQPQGKFLT
jgi:hypothetical protein